MTGDRRRRRSGILAVLLAASLTQVGCGGEAAEAHGWIEGREVDVAPMVSGRLESMRVDEGDTVVAGDTIALLTRAETPAELEGARSRAEAARARLAQLEAGSRREDVAAAAAEAQAAQAELENARREFTRLSELTVGESISRQKLDDARTAVERAQGRRDVARQQLERLRAGARPQELEAARAEAGAAEAAYRSALATAGELVLTAPVGGPVLLRNFDPGELVPAGRPVVTLLGGDERWLRVWLPETALGRVNVGDEARVRIDPFPDSTFPAQVVSIATKAEFTPRVALTEEERSDLMYAVKLRLLDPSPLLKVGLPASAEFAERLEDR